MSIYPLFIDSVHHIGSNQYGEDDAMKIVFVWSETRIKLLSNANAVRQRYNQLGLSDTASEL
jgi:hypothetical protein